MSAENMTMWAALSKTDPSATKSFKRSGGFVGTAINGTYVIKRLTQQFGPCGYGWKFVIEDERIEDGYILNDRGDRARLHIIRGHIEYMIDGEWYCTSPQFGQTMLVDNNKYGVFMDEEAPKKSITDCIGKCAVLLGIGADVHMGLFDDNKYVNERKKDEARETASQKAPAVSAPVVKSEVFMNLRGDLWSAIGIMAETDQEGFEAINDLSVEARKRMLPDLRKAAQGVKESEAYAGLSHGEKAALVQMWTNMGAAMKRSDGE